ncbi:hypothetical protein BT63DRAFT_377881 [Microthyrium microscopicum]|uniref:Asl1-like glycosyl hydrolase catalytic domain-containing protein n=1 Tax=Microthyrium microscopicum TaxID=703497 RepID=A0A6A6TZJ1_9PEZI|nr:hypothetical protein BT63DRAFT_377881 [Microthyrium microscopicum]
MPAPVVSAPASQAPPAASSTQASAPSAAPSTGNNGACARPAAKTLSTKRGVSYNTASLLAPFGSSISWAYNWGSNPSGSMPSNVVYEPMLWTSQDQSRVNTWNADATAAIAAGAQHLLGFNEPDLSTQSNIDPATAAAGWKKDMEPLACKARLVSPAVTNGGAPSGLTWLSSFLSACSGCTIDAVAIHWYDSATNIAYFKQHVSDAYTAGGNRPIWITEFGASGTDDQVSAFFAAVLPWLDAQPYVERYAYFMANDGILLSSATTLSAIGKAYIAN